LGVLDDYERAAMAGDAARTSFLGENIGPVCAALVAAVRAVNGRNDMLRVVETLHCIIWGNSYRAVNDAIAGIVAADREPRDFVEPILKIAIERVSDAEVSALAADCLATIYGSAVLEYGSVVDRQTHKLANDQTRSLVTSLITEVALTASPRALAAMGALLRRDFARFEFCERDGISTLASMLGTSPEHEDTTIGQAVVAGVSRATSVLEREAVAATYHSVFAVWMLSFAASERCVEKVWSSAMAAGLVLVLSKLLNHVSGRRLKIARVVLGALRNFAEGSSAHHRNIRREMIGAGVMGALSGLSRLGTILESDIDAANDAEYLMETLAKDQVDMSTLELYLGELRAGALRWTPIHTDVSYWTLHAESMISETTDVLPLLANIIGTTDPIPSEVRAVACSDVAQLLRYSVTGRTIARGVPNLKKDLMILMTSADDPSVRGYALTCVQLLLLTSMR
jgi:V-ATPase subunit H